MKNEVTKQQSFGVIFQPLKDLAEETALKKKSYGLYRYTAVVRIRVCTDVQYMQGEYSNVKQ